MYHAISVGLQSKLVLYLEIPSEYTEIYTLEFDHMKGCTKWLPNTICPRTVFGLCKSTLNQKKLSV